MEVIPHGVVDEALLVLIRLALGLIAKDHVVVPPALHPAARRNRRGSSGRRTAPLASRGIQQRISGEGRLLHPRLLLAGVLLIHPLPLLAGRLLLPLLPRLLLAGLLLLLPLPLLAGRLTAADSATPLALAPHADRPRAALAGGRVKNPNT